MAYSARFIIISTLIRSTVPLLRPIQFRHAINPKAVEAKATGYRAVGRTCFGRWYPQ